MSSGTASSPFASLERAVPAPVRARLARYAPFLLFLGLLVLCGYLAARLSWQFAAPAVTAPATQPGGNSSEIAGVTADTPGNTIVSAHLFGRANAPSSTVAARNAPETTLDFTLAGVAAGNPDSLSYAIITNGSNRGKDTYAVGAQLPGGAEIRNILPDRVVIAHNGRLETLRLPWADLSNLKPSEGTSSAGERNTHPSRISQGVTEQLQSHPHSLMDYIRIRPYMQDKKLVGVSVYPGKKPRLFRKSGLQPGDIITSVNGITLSSRANSAKAMDELRNSEGPVQLSILRKGHHITVTINPGG